MGEQVLFIHFLQEVNLLWSESFGIIHVECEILVRYVSESCEFEIDVFLFYFVYFSVVVLSPRSELCLRVLHQRASLAIVVDTTEHGGEVFVGVFVHFGFINRFYQPELFLRPRGHPAT